MNKEIVEKENWYKTKNDDEDDEMESPSKYLRTDSKLREQSCPRTGRVPRRHVRKTAVQEEVSSVMFIPHTVGSALAKELKEKENILKEITGDKMKIVERAGLKLEDVLTRTNPWKGMDCGRPNCLLCLTKTLTGKDKKKDCTKRNILYELRCLTCEEKLRTEIEESEDDEENKKEKLKNMRVPRYVGESSRFLYEQAFENMDDCENRTSKGTR